MTLADTGLSVLNRPGDAEVASEYLASFARTSPSMVAMTFIDYSTERSGTRSNITFAELDRAVTATATRLQQVAMRGERVAILAPQGLRYVVGVLAAMRAGMVAVPLFSPDLPGHAQRLREVLADCRPRVLLSARTNRALVDAAAEEVLHRDGDAVCVVDLDDIPDELADSFSPVECQPHDVAYLQYTSGSTRSATGVMISHGNLVANSLQSTRSIHIRGGRGEMVSWLPMFHDMGLVSVVGTGVVGGWHVTFMDPAAFLMKPVRWLSALSAGRNTVTFAPNFAFDYCAAKVTDAQKANLRMENIQLLGNGSEPVRPDTLRRFNEAFAPCGLSPSALRGVYGLAEATVYVTGRSADKPAPIATVDFHGLEQGCAVVQHDADATVVKLASSGAPGGQLVVIAEPQTGIRNGDGAVGEIWVRGPNVSPGYWNQPELTADVFDQTLLNSGSLPANGWMRTGDLGVLLDGQLYVTGRIKDMIIVDGRNIYPHDLEAVVENTHDVVGRHRSAVFGVESDGREAVVVVAEVSRHAAGLQWNPAEVRAAVRAALTRAFSIPVRDVVLVAPNEVPRTTSGKVSRREARRRYEAGQLCAYGEMN